MRVMQIGALAFAIWSIRGDNDEQYAPSTMDVAFWREYPTESGPDNPPHCSDMEAYLYNFSRSWQYAPNGCEELLRGEDFMKTGLTEGFFATIIKDTTEETGYGSVDCSAMASKCQRIGGAFQPNVSSKKPCTCAKVTEFYAKNIEKNMFAFRHAYSVQDTHDGKSFMRGFSSLGYYTTDQKPGEEVKGKMLTRLLKLDGSPCLVGGKSDFLSGEGDIVGSIEEWLACGSYTLETQSDETRGWGPEENMAPHLRTSGALVSLEMRYWNKHRLARNNVVTVCDVYVAVRPSWNSRQTIDHMREEEMGEGQLARRFRFRYAQGISFTFKKGGSFAFFNPHRLLTSVVNAIVLLSIPVQVVGFIALYGIGDLSTVYYNVAYQRFDLFRHLLAQSIRMIMASLGFRMLTKQLDAREADLRTLSYEDIQDSLRESIGAVLNNPTTGEGHADEAKNMAALVAARLEGMDHTEGFSFGEFMRASSYGEPIDVDSAALFTDHWNPVTGIFDDTRSTIKSARKRRKSFLVAGTSVSSMRGARDELSRPSIPNDAPSALHPVTEWEPQACSE